MTKSHKKTSGNNLKKYLFVRDVLRKFLLQAYCHPKTAVLRWANWHNIHPVLPWWTQPQIPSVAGRRTLTHEISSSLLGQLLNMQQDKFPKTAVRSRVKFICISTSCEETQQNQKM
jgi:hypothetical protein